MSAFNTSEIMEIIEKGDPARITFYYHNEGLLRSIDALFAKLLANIDIVFLLDSTITVLREIIANAVKANAKRSYFKKLNLDINDPDAYKQGIVNFKRDVMEDASNVERVLEGSDYRVNLTIHKKEDRLLVVTENNVAILPEEMSRVNKRIEKAKLFKDFSEAYNEIFDDTEGAGLGIVLTIMLLKNSGIGEDSYMLICDGNATRSQFNIPFHLQPQTITTKIKEQIAKDVDGLPTFQEHILELQRLCENPEATINDIVDKIMMDPALTSDILKLANSAGFITSKRIEHINEAVMIIGLDNLKNLLIATGARNILEKRYPKFEEIWAHCNKTAFYARQIALKHKMGKIAENAFLSGLLHDLGKIVLLSTDKKFNDWIAQIVKNRMIRTATVMEEVTLGISHSSIGELMAKKWQFPEYLIEAITYHHSPLNASEEYRDYVFVVYLANMLCGIEAHKYNTYHLEEQVLERFNIASESKFEKFHSHFMNLYETHKEINSKNNG